MKYYNSEHYNDPTAGRAIENVAREERQAKPNPRKPNSSKKKSAAKRRRGPCNR